MPDDKFYEINTMRDIIDNVPTEDLDTFIDNLHLWLRIIKESDSPSLFSPTMVWKNNGMAEQDDDTEYKEWKTTNQTE